MSVLKAQIPEKLGFLLAPARYKVAWGGRGSGKSWSVARALLLLGRSRPLRVLCTREYQISIAQSVHALLADQVKQLGLDDFYTVQNAEIFGPNGTQFMFAGLRQNINNLKSYEGVDVVWIEEAANVTKASWDVLIPTIRRPESEIWVTFNPELDSDETYKRFVLDPPGIAKVVKANYTDNPWFPDVLQQEMLALKARDPDAYLNVWEGHCKQALEGAIYAAELRNAAQEGRICRVPYEPTNPVHRFWDLGWADNTAIWFAQFIGLDIRIINHLAGSRRRISDYLADCNKLGYNFGEDWLPHDGEYGNAASEGRSVSQILRRAGCNVHTVPRTASVVADIDRVRAMFPRMLFDEKNCVEGIQALRRYCWNTDDDGATKGREPKHDANSHSADALRCLGMAVDLVSGNRRNKAPSYTRADGAYNPHTW